MILCAIFDYMKRLLLLLTFILCAACSFAQNKGGATQFRSSQEVQHRIDELIRTKQYPTTQPNFEPSALVSLGTIITGDTVINKLGMLKKKSKKKYKLAYNLKYSIKADKIVSIELPKKKKKRFLVF